MKNQTIKWTLLLKFKSFLDKSVIKEFEQAGSSNKYNYHTGTLAWEDHPAQTEIRYIFDNTNAMTVILKKLVGKARKLNNITGIKFEVSCHSFLKEIQ